MKARQATTTGLATSAQADPPTMKARCPPLGELQLEGVYLGRAMLSPLGTADAFVAKHRDDLLAVPLGNGSQVTQMVFHGLSSGADSNVDRRASGLDFMAVLQWWIGANTPAESADH